VRALDPEVMDYVFGRIAELIPPRTTNHPLGCHRKRVPDRLCFFGILVRLVTGCSWQTTEALLNYQVSDTTLRARRDEWIEAGVFDKLRAEALATYNDQIGLDLTNVALDGSLHKAPCGGEGTGKSPVDRRKLGWKWSSATDGNGVLLGWAIAGANRSDLKLLIPTLRDIARHQPLDRIGTIHLDRYYDFPKIRRQLQDHGLTNPNIQRRKPIGGTRPPSNQQLGHRWVVEGTHSWLSNYGQLRRNTDRRTIHRHAQLCLAATLIIAIKLINQQHQQPPIR